MAVTTVTKPLQPLQFVAASSADVARALAAAWAALASDERGARAISRGGGARAPDSVCASASACRRSWQSRERLGPSGGGRVRAFHAAASSPAAPQRAFVSSAENSFAWIRGVAVECAVLLSGCQVGLELDGKEAIGPSEKRMPAPVAALAKVRNSIPQSCFTHSESAEDRMPTPTAMSRGEPTSCL